MFDQDQQPARVRIRIRWSTAPASAPALVPAVTPDDALLLANIIRWARVQWHAGVAGRPISDDQERRLGLLERRLRMADVSQSGPIPGADTLGCA